MHTAFPTLLLLGSQSLPCDSAPPCGLTHRGFGSWDEDGGSMPGAWDQRGDVLWLGSGRVTRVLEWLTEKRGRPESVRSDHGPEFCSRRMLGWPGKRKVALVHIQPGRLVQNGHVESFHGRLRDECLNSTWFCPLADMRHTVASWREESTASGPTARLLIGTLLSSGSR